MQHNKKKLTLASSTFNPSLCLLQAGSFDQASTSPQSQYPPVPDDACICVSKTNKYALI